MKTIFTSLALIAGGLSLAGWSVAAETTADPNCAAAPACPCGTCCPQCGCHEGLVPVCHSYCTTKKTTKYKYCCKCDTICVPNGCACNGGCGCKEGGCASGCGCNEGCGEGHHCNCSIYEVHKLTKIPYVEEECVHKCTVEWVCPKCGCNCPCANGAAAPAAPAAPGAIGPGSTTPLPPPPAGKAAATPGTPDAAGYYSASDR
jgi:hypothetical protein